MKQLTLLFFAILFLHPAQISFTQLETRSDMTQYSKEVDDLVKKLYPSVQGNVTSMPRFETVDTVAERLIEIAEESPETRQLVVDSLIKILKSTEHKPLGYSETWIYAASILAKMKADEALNIIVKKIDFRGLFASISAGYRPLVNLVVAYGEVAIPYLEEAMLEGDASVRQEASLALGLIGGQRAKDILERALAKEKDSEVIISIKAGLYEVGRH